MTQVNYFGIIARAISLASKMKGKNKEFLMLPRAWLEMGLLLMATKVSHCSRAETHRPKDNARRLNNGTFFYIPCLQQAAQIVENAGCRVDLPRLIKLISFLDSTGRGICTRACEASVAFPTIYRYLAKQSPLTYHIYVQRNITAEA